MLVAQSDYTKKESSVGKIVEVLLEEPLCLRACRMATQRSLEGFRRLLGDLSPNLPWEELHPLVLRPSLRQFK